MRVMYLTWGEVPRLSSVYGGQVVFLVSALQKQPEIENVTLLSAYPMIHSGMAREKWRYKHQLSAIRDKIGRANFLTRRIPVPPVGVHPKRWQLPFFTTGQHKYLADAIKSRDVDVVQCRSYVATHLALETREMFGLSYKIGFDARSLLPEEGVVSGRWALGDKDFTFWKEREKQMLAEADFSTAVSKPMKAGYERIGARRVDLINLNVSVGNLDEKLIADTSRLDKGEPVIAYSGFLSDKTWHKPLDLWRVFDSFRKHCPGAKLLVITKSNPEHLTESLRNTNMAHLLDAIHFTSASSPAEVVNLLHSADLSVLSYFHPQNDFEKALAEPVFGTKSAEYLCVGLPIIVNSYIGGVREYIQELNAGVAYDPANLLSAEDVATLLRQSRDRLSISQSARPDFSIDENAARLVRIYGEVLGQT